MREARQYVQTILWLLVANGNPRTIRALMCYGNQLIVSHAETEFRDMSSISGNVLIDYRDSGRNLRILHVTSVNYKFMPVYYSSWQFTLAMKTITHINSSR